MSLLAFLHGVGNTPTSWQDQVTAMPSHIKAVAPWLKGLRPDKEDSFSVESAADDVLGQLNVFGMDEMALCGLSLGAIVALAAAVRAPAHISHLVVVAGQVKPPKMLMKAQLLAMRALPESRFTAAGLKKEKMIAVLKEAANVDFRDSLSLVTARTLVVVGEEDKINQPAARELAKGIAEARLEIIPHAGHLAPMEQPDRFNDLLYDFLAEEN